MPDTSARQTRFTEIFASGDDTEITRDIPVEVPVALEFNGIAYAVMMATPTHLADFVTGFAITEGLVKRANEIGGIDIAETDKGWLARAQLSAEAAEPVMERARRRVSESSCGLCGIENLEQIARPLPRIAAPLAVEPQAIFAALGALRDHQKLGRRTAAAHAAAFCDLGGAILAGATLDGASLEGVMLMHTKLDRASMKQVKLTGNSLFGAVGGAVDLSGAELELLHVLELDLRGSRFVGASIKLTAFVKAKVDGADFSGANLLQSGFIESTGEKARFDGATLERVLWGLGSVFDGSSFVKVAGKMSCLRGCSFRGADFSDAKLESCDLGEANLENARLHRTSLKGSYLAKIDLKHADARGADMTEVIFQKADVHGADLRGVNFFRADMAKVRGDKATNLKDAYVAQVRVVPEPDRKEKLL